MGQTLQDYADEILDISKELWAVQAAYKSKDHLELTETEFLALDIITKSSQPLSVGEIQKRIGILPAQMSRVIRGLEKRMEKPLVECKINPLDKRKVDVELTEAGRRSHEEYRNAKLACIQQILLPLSDADRQELLRILRIVRSSVYKL
jgi:DNA-binding MarR family transcriptional regulator